jgi:hypothetical protein
MTAETGEAFRAALSAHMSERDDQTFAALNEAAAVHAGQLPADPAEVPAGLAVLHERAHTDQSTHPAVMRAADEAVATYALAAGYERLRDDPDADPADVNAAADALALARQAHRVAAGLPLTAGVA